MANTCSCLEDIIAHKIQTCLLFHGTHYREASIQSMFIIYRPSTQQNHYYICQLEVETGGATIAFVAFYPGICIWWCFLGEFPWWRISIFSLTNRIYDIYICIRGKMCLAKWFLTREIRQNFEVVDKWKCILLDFQWEYGKAINGVSFQMVP